MGTEPESLTPSASALIRREEEMSVDVRHRTPWGPMVWFLFVSFLIIDNFSSAEEKIVLASDIHHTRCSGKSEDSISHMQARRKLEDVAASTVLDSDRTTLSGNSKNYVGRKHARRKLDDIGGDINIDCGLPMGSRYLDEKINFYYTSEEDVINNGVNKNVSARFMSADLQKSLATLRSFPQGSRSCYTLSPPEGKEKIYLVRASFMYGDYDEQDKLPEFDLYVGVNQWDTVKFDNASHVVIKEILHKALLDQIFVCLVNTGKGTPFISALEVRHFHTSTYIYDSRVALDRYQRLDVGSQTNQIIRFEDDKYDRMWFPYPGPVSIATTSTIDSLNESEYRLPSAVMSTAAEPKNVNVSLDLEFEIGDSPLGYYVYMHFAELEKLSANQSREFNIEINGNLWQKSVVLDYLRSTTIATMEPVTGSNLRFSLYKTSKSTLPPILNALEIYAKKDFLQAYTDQEDVNAIMDIKKTYELDRLGWQGDPCEPIYAWDGLNCSKNGYQPPQIISLNLTSRGLTGRIFPSFSKLKSLQYLDLSNNSLTGPLPDFLSQLPLRVLKLEGNKLSGAVPESLKARSQNDSLALSVDGNPDLCLSPPCKKQKRNIKLLLIAVIVPILVVIFIALLILWSYRRKKAANVDAKSRGGSVEGSLESDSHKFTYSEIVNITNNFNRVLGKGGFGTVYHGSLFDGTQVAVKMLSPSSSQGSKQFRTEAQLLMRVHHKNLVSLVGYCNDSGNFGVMYEYMAHGNLKQSLSDKSKKALSWKERIKIAVDTAQGLEYLHHGCKPPIVHRDVKTANILLNEQMQAKIADFGLSKLFPVESADSHLWTSIVGTVGYLDPEYCVSNKLTEKSDVYSFGIVVLELITGQPVVIKGHENTHLVQWTELFLARGDIKSIIDPRLEADFDINSVWKAAETAMGCVASISSQRPSMTHVVAQLNESWEIEVARERTKKLDSKGTGTSSPVDVIAVDVETVMGPQAR